MLKVRVVGVACCEETAFLTNYRETLYLYPIVKLEPNLADAQSDILPWLHLSKCSENADGKP